MLLGFAMLLLALSIVGEGETSMGFGILWWYSIPMVVVLGATIGKLTHRRYCQVRSVIGQFAILAVLAAGTVVLAPIVTFGGFSLVQMLGGFDVT